MGTMDGVKEIKAEKHQWYESAQVALKSMLNKATDLCRKTTVGVTFRPSAWKVIKA